jgi:lipopolysaccharide/colanic/teichoic acid biosynthesis glycosyltransferase
LPGITGWAQVNGRDKIDVDKKVKLDSEYLESQSTYLDIKIIGLTLLAVLGAKGISH